MSPTPKKTSYGLDEKEVEKLAYLLFERRQLHIQKDDEFSWLREVPADQSRLDDWHLAQQFLGSPYKDKLVKLVTEDLENLQNGSAGKRERR